VGNWWRYLPIWWLFGVGPYNSLIYITGPYDSFTLYLIFNTTCNFCCGV
jgi:hypothetical protein